MTESIAKNNTSNRTSHHLHLLFKSIPHPTLSPKPLIHHHTNPQNSANIYKQLQTSIVEWNTYPQNLLTFTQHRLTHAKFMKLKTATNLHGTLQAALANYLLGNSVSTNQFYYYYYCCYYCCFCI